MLVLPACRVAVFGFWVFLVLGLLAAKNCCGERDTLEVVGGAECADCVQHNIKTSRAFKGLRVTIDCKSEDGKLKTRGGSELDREGKFRANLPSYDQISEDGGELKLKEDCFAQLHSASGALCAIRNNKKDSKFVLKSKANGQQVLGLNGNLKFSPITCPSAFLWLYFPPLPNFPTYSPPPTPTPPQPLPPSRPAYTNPTPPAPAPAPAPAPVYNNPPTAQPKASTPPVPVNNDPAPMPSPVSIEPIPPASPSPDYGQFLPPPFPHKSFPQIPKAPPIPQLPPTPTTPRKFFNKPLPP